MLSLVKHTAPISTLTLVTVAATTTTTTIDPDLSSLVGVFVVVARHVTKAMAEDDAGQEHLNQSSDQSIYRSLVESYQVVLGVKIKTAPYFNLIHQLQSKPFGVLILERQSESFHHYKLRNKLGERQDGLR